MSDERIEKALAIATAWACVDGAHHKAWVFDQMVRALTDCPNVPITATGVSGHYTFEGQGESQEYQEFVACAKDGEDGPETYEWPIGIAP